MRKIVIPIVLGVIAVISIVFILGYDLSNTEKTIDVMKAEQSSPFGRPVEITQLNRDSQPAPNIAIDDSGKMFIVYDSTEDGITNLYIKTSADNGRTFSAPVQVNSIEGNVVLDGRVAPSIAIDDDDGNDIYVLWANSTPEPNLFMGVYRTLVLAKSVDGGESFLPSIQIAADESPSGKFFQNMAISGDGDIHVAWLDSPVKNNGTGYLTSDNSRPSTVKYAQSTDGGISFMPTQILDEDPCPCCNVQVAADEDNNVYVSWRKVFDDGQTQIRDMVIASSVNGGETFSNPVKIHQDNFNFNGCVHVGAPMAVDSKGNLHVVWYTGKQSGPGIYYATSSDRGQTFSQPISILTADWIPPQRVYLAIDGGDTVWITWEDATGYSINEEIWRYADTKAMIYAAKITPDGEMTVFENPVTIDEGKSPVIAAGDDNLVSIVWADVNNSVKLAVIP